VTAVVHRRDYEKSFSIFTYSKTNNMITYPKLRNVLTNGVLEFLFNYPVLLISPPDEGTLRIHVPGNQKQS
jgi:hypothetical protein